MQAPLAPDPMKAIFGPPPSGDAGRVRLSWPQIWHRNL